jgi:uncharacterized membrane protein
LEGRKMKISHVVCYLLLVIAAFTACVPFSLVLAQEETIILEATYPRVESDAPGAIFRFTVVLIYEGDQDREFDLQTSGPPGWNTYVASRDESTRISSIRLEPNGPEPYRVRVIASPLPSTMLKADEYTITLVASSGNIRDSIELTAVVMPTYSLDLFPRDSWYYGDIITGEDNFVTITAENTGSGELTGIKFSAHEPKGWLIEFQPGEMERLAPGSSREVEVNIKPPAGTDERYYHLTIVAEARQARQTTEVRVHVEGPKWMWMWVGGGVAVLVVGAFIFVFWRFGRGK